LLLAGCGSGKPQLRRQDAAQLITLANAIAREAPCAQARDIRRLRARTTVLVSEQHVPAQLERQLVAGVNALNPPVCLPAVVTTTPTPTPNPPGHEKKKHDHGKHHGHGDDEQ
jgi:hypothetical protein